MPQSSFELYTNKANLELQILLHSPSDCYYYRFLQVCPVYVALVTTTPGLCGTISLCLGYTMLETEHRASPMLASILLLELHPQLFLMKTLNSTSLAKDG